MIHTEIMGGMDKRRGNTGGHTASPLNLKSGGGGFTCISHVLKASHTPGRGRGKVDDGDYNVKSGGCWRKGNGSIRGVKIKMKKPRGR